MALRADQLTFLYSGGSGNTEPRSSVGGIVSGTVIQRQSFSVGNNIPGVTVLGVYGLRPSVFLPIDNQTLRWQLETTTRRLYFEDFNNDLYPNYPVGIDLLNFDPGVYEVAADTDANENSGRRIVIDVSPGLLPATDLIEAISGISVANANVFDDVQKSQYVGGYVDYRCIYLANQNPAGAANRIVDVSIDLVSEGPEENTGELNAGGVLQYAVDPAGVGDGTTTGVAIGPLTPLGDILPEEDPNNQLSSLSAAWTNSETFIGDLDPGEMIAIWMRRTYPGFPTADYSPDVHMGLTVNCATVF